jgi:alanine-synthesizing transaminase
MTLTAVLHPIRPARRLDGVTYDIRGPLHARALALEDAGQSVLRLNIGNPGRFGFEVPQHLRDAMAQTIPASESYGHQQGLIEAREAIAAVQQARGVPNAHPNRVFIGNGVSELIDVCLRALLHDGDEVLVPSPDYPLWTAAVHLNGGVPVHYPCRPENGALPDPTEIEARVSKRTRALVLINPNNPTGAVYPKELVEDIVRIAERHGLVLFTDEIYEALLYDGAEFTPAAPCCHGTLCVTMSGLSKVHRACGWRVGWASLSGAVERARDYLQALDLLTALRLCSNVPGQQTIVPALTGPDTWTALCQPGGRLYDTRAEVLSGIERSPFLSLAAPMGAMYAFPGVDTQAIPDFDDARFALDLLEEKRILIVPGSSFNVPYRNHFRITLLPEAAVMRRVFREIDDLLATYAARHLPQAAVA